MTFRLTRHLRQRRHRILLSHNLTVTTGYAKLSTIWVTVGSFRSFVSSIDNRKHRDCEKCNRNISKIEQHLVTRLRDKYPQLQQQVRFTLDNGRYTVVDMVVENVVIEYDGSYWHKDTVDKDTQSTMQHIGNGHSVIRIREHSEQHTLKLLPLDVPQLWQLPYTYTKDHSHVDNIISALCAIIDKNLSPDESKV